MQANVLFLLAYNILLQGAFTPVSADAEEGVNRDILPTIQNPWSLAPPLSVFSYVACQIASRLEDELEGIGSETESEMSCPFPSSSPSSSSSSSATSSSGSSTSPTSSSTSVTSSSGTSPSSSSTTGSSTGTSSSSTGTSSSSTGTSSSSTGTSSSSTGTSSSSTGTSSSSTGTSSSSTGTSTSSSAPTSTSSTTTTSSSSSSTTPPTIGVTATATGSVGATVRVAHPSFSSEYYKRDIAHQMSVERQGVLPTLSGNGVALGSIVIGGGLLPALTLGGIIGGGNNGFALGGSATVAGGGIILPSVSIGGGASAVINPFLISGTVINPMLINGAASGTIFEGGALSGLVPTVAAGASISGLGGLMVSPTINGLLAGDAGASVSVGYAGLILPSSSFVANVGGNFDFALSNTPQPTSTTTH
ncbi:hypothetical protein GQ54DRAFT_303252 [Martensiomyces pterosporus]|nr:hypothetical protein GQ54DRAFT_303252 [Martensiomyces pterosporus]